MATLVVDASVIVKLFVPEAGSREASAHIRAASERLIPAHALAEVGEILARKARKGDITRDQLEEVVPTLMRGLISVPVEDLLESAMAMSLETGASVYDCLYVALAAVEGCPLVTADRRLAEKMSASAHGGLLRLLGT